MPAKPISLAHLDFESRGDAEDYLNRMLERHELGQSVVGDDFVILEAALARHPDALLKTGVGIAGFSVGSADFGTKCFWVVRSDGTKEKFSVRSCVYTKRTSSV